MARQCISLPLDLLRRPEPHEVTSLTDVTTDKPQAKAGLGIDARCYPKVRYVRWKQIKSLLLYITYLIGFGIT